MLLHMNRALTALVVTLTIAAAAAVVLQACPALAKMSHIAIRPLDNSLVMGSQGFTVKLDYTMFSFDANASFEIIPALPNMRMTQHGNCENDESCSFDVSFDALNDTSLINTNISARVMTNATSPPSPITNTTFIALVLPQVRTVDTSASTHVVLPHYALALEFEWNPPLDIANLGAVRLEELSAQLVGPAGSSTPLTLSVNREQGQPAEVTSTRLTLAMMIDTSNGPVPVGVYALSELELFGWNARNRAPLLPAGSAPVNVAQIGWALPDETSQLKDCIAFFAPKVKTGQTIRCIVETMFSNARTISNTTVFEHVMVNGSLGQAGPFYTLPDHPYELYFNYTAPASLDGSISSFVSINVTAQGKPIIDSPAGIKVVNSPNSPTPSPAGPNKPKDGTHVNFTGDWRIVAIVVPLGIALLVAVVAAFLIVRWRNRRNISNNQYMPINTESA